MHKDRKERIRKVAEEVEGRLKGNNVLGAYKILRYWYRKRIKRTKRPCEGDLEEKRGTYKALFEHKELNNEPLTFEYEGTEVNDEVPTEEEIIHFSG